MFADSYDLDIKRVTFVVELGSVSTISCDQPCKDGSPIHNGTLNALSDQE